AGVFAVAVVGDLAALDGDVGGEARGRIPVDRVLAVVGQVAAADGQPVAAHHRRTRVVVDVAVFDRPAGVHPGVEQALLVWRAVAGDLQVCDADVRAAVPVFALDGERGTLPVDDCAGCADELCTVPGLS